MKIAPRRPRPDEWREAAEVFIAARAAMPYLPGLHTRAETRAFVRSVIETLEVWVVDASLGGAPRIAGLAAINAAPGETWLDHLYIHPAMQNHGLGAALLDVAKALHPQGFSLWTFQQNTGARRFYERHGLTLARLTDGRDNEEKLPDALYEWRGERYPQEDVRRE
ncbi:MAG: GNAT family N-acetyltransferase [Parvibaculum sp.]|uniref:GNAT family N-acetyltransferase n=1 Tax=Parvibaculum sp. TaxID=2024848 RepID=UPI0025FC4F16|nr:GNAT family N-acetyltransferase [Parvibaculum sp.]MCE9648007.1 GNAT family N-acetyltransferase [Parvibaculum sp.]